MGNRNKESRKADMSVLWSLRYLTFAICLLCMPLCAQIDQSAFRTGSINSTGLYRPNGDLGRSARQEPTQPGILRLTLDMSLDAALRNSLASLLQGDTVRYAAGQVAITRSDLLPTVSGSVVRAVATDNLVPRGLTQLAGVSARNDIVGPYDSFDARAYVQQSVFDWRALQSWLSSRLQLKAERLSLQDTRNLVVQATALSYFQVIAEEARVTTAEAQVATADHLAGDAHQRLTIGISPAIDASRADVTLAMRREELLTDQNRLAQARITLARVIGLPLTQIFSIVTRPEWQDREPPSFDTVTASALANRPDYAAAKARLAAASNASRAARAGYYPSFGISGNYGDFGKEPGASHGTFLAQAFVQFPIYLGGRTQGEVAQANALQGQRQSDISNLTAEIEEQIRRDLLDLNTSRAEVLVAKESVQLANQTLQQATERFGEGIASNLEVVQAQESQATANESYIASVYAYQTAATNLARNSGNTRDGIKILLF